MNLSEDFGTYATGVKLSNISNCSVIGNTDLTKQFPTLALVRNSTNSTNEENELIPIIRQPVYMIVIYAVAYGIVFLFALLGNTIVVILIIRTRRLHTLTNFFIVNLAIADILVAVFCVPITLLDNLYNGGYP